MGPIDYSKKISNNQNRYNEQVRKLENAHDRELDSVKKQRDYKLDSQKEAYTKDLRDLESRFSNREQEMSDFISNELEDKKEELRQNLFDVKSDFSRKTSEQQDRYNDRLKKLNTAFDESLASSESTFENKNKVLKKNYEEGLKTQQRKFDDYIDRSKEGSAFSTDALLKKSKDDLNNNTKFYEDKLRQKSKENTIAQAELRDKFNKSYEDMSRTRENDLERTRQSFDQRVDSLRDNQQKGLNANKEKYEEIIKNNDQKFSEKYADQQLNHKKDYELLEEKYQAKNALRAATAEDRSFADRLQGEYKDSIAKERKRYTDRLDRMRDGHKKDRESLLRDMRDTHERAMIKGDNQRANSVAEQVRLNKEARQEFSNNLNNERLKNLEQRDQFNAFKDNLEKDYNQKEFKNNYRHKTSIDALTTHHSEQIADLEHKQDERISGIKMDDNLDKKMFMKKIQDDTADYHRELKKDFAEKSLVRDSAYQNQISQLKNTIARLNLQKESNYEMLTNSKNNSLKAQKDFYTNQLEGQAHDAYLENKLKDQQWLSDNNNLRSSLGQKISEQSIGYEKKLNKIINDYESQITKLRNDHNKKFRSAEEQSKYEQKMMKVHHEREKDMLIAKYEENIRDLKNNYAQEEEKMRFFVEKQSQRA